MFTICVLCQLACNNDLVRVNALSHKCLCFLKSVFANVIFMMNATVATVGLRICLTLLTVLADWHKWRAKYWEESSTATLSTTKCAKCSKQWHATSLYFLIHSCNNVNVLFFCISWPLY